MYRHLRTLIWVLPLLDLDPGATQDHGAQAMGGHILAEGRFTVNYGR